ncbi:MAG TPA: hypothetical protein VNX15_04635 [Gemmatimonadales bacterium]|jgi:hypothetical protein|nr:hypothetical protein [Gemmatimonadales bacterium]
MTNLPAKTPKTEIEDTEPTPTWRELGERFRGLLHDLWDEGKDIERELEPKVLPALKRLRDEVVKLIEKIEGRNQKPG